jgi:2-keto-4-pentenoate hydratase/2-oxohepta-3-ene-1,7-dioic acid hydratase in catechol pathway
MIFKLPFLIRYLSQYFTLEPGDLIFTGTPKGVGRIETGKTYAAFMGEERLLSFDV